MQRRTKEMKVLIVCAVVLMGASDDLKFPSHWAKNAAVDLRRFLKILYLDRCWDMWIKYQHTKSRRSQQALEQ